jgi:hypothetical protein
VAGKSDQRQHRAHDGHDVDQDGPADKADYPFQYVSSDLGDFPSDAGDLTLNIDADIGDFGSSAGDLALKVVPDFIDLRAEGRP